MPTLVLDPPPADFEALLERRRERRMHWLALQPGGEYQPVERSEVIAPGPVELAEQIDWPE